MRYISIPEGAFKACDAVQHFGSDILMGLVRHAFTGDGGPAENATSGEVAVFAGFHDEIDASLVDDAEVFAPCDAEDEPAKLTCRVTPMLVCLSTEEEPEEE